MEITEKTKEVGKKITCDTSPQRISIMNILTYFLPRFFLYTYICEIEIIQCTQVGILFLKYPEHLTNYEKLYISITCKGCSVLHHTNAH